MKYEFIFRLENQCELKKGEKSYTETVTTGIFNCDLKNAIWRPFKIQILLEYSNKGSM